MNYYKVDPKDIERFYAKAAASGVYAPLDPGELDSMEDRLTGRVTWRREWDKNTERFITLTVLHQAAILQNGALVVLPPGTYRVVSVGTDHFYVDLDGLQVSLGHSQR